MTDEVWAKILHQSLAIQAGSDTKSQQVTTDAGFSKSPKTQ
jgi:hypothetical protein